MEESWRDYSKMIYWGGSCSATKRKKKNTTTPRHNLGPRLFIPDRLPEPRTLGTPSGNSNSKSRLNLKFLKIKNLEIIILDRIIGEIQNQRRRA